MQFLDLQQRCDCNVVGEALCLPKMMVKQLDIGKQNHPTILSLPIHECKCFSICLWVLKFLSTVFCCNKTSFHLLPKFILQYFISFGAIVNEIVFKISFSDSLLLVYRTVSICCFISYNFTQFMYSNSIFMESLEFSV